eukprot:Phypoly_transcript_08529.p1 GENE.Phypoly_transcript_08529~~Phypoly_transcript_08529.p1  ORF type:complete len:376 (-),score=139.80 Phypoly_transcript_08529:270-1397(-)
MVAKDKTAKNTPAKAKDTPAKTKKVEEETPEQEVEETAVAPKQDKKKQKTEENGSKAAKKDNKSKKAPKKEESDAVEEEKAEEPKVEKKGKKEKKDKKAKKEEKVEEVEEVEEDEEMAEQQEEEAEEEDAEEKGDNKRKRDEEEDEEEEESSPKVAKTDGEARPVAYVTLLSFDVNEDGLRAHFSDVGEIKSLEWVNDASDTFCGGAVLTFEDVATAEKAAQKDRTDLDSRSISVQPHKAFPSGCKTIFIGGLPKDLDEEAFKKYLTDNGASFSSTRFPTDRDSGGYKGIGFVDFDTEEEASAFYNSNIQAKGFNGRALKFDPSLPREGGGGGGGRGGRGGFRGGRGGDRGGRGGRGGFRGGRGGGSEGKRTSFD